MKSAEQWIDELQLESHPEGGFYRETIREVLKDGRRAPFSSIYFFYLQMTIFRIFIELMLMKYGTIMLVIL